MKKTIYLLTAWCTVLSGLAKMHELNLPVQPGAQETYFLNLKNTGADSNHFKLLTPEGKDVPFSFDMMIDLPQNTGKARHSPDGFYSKEFAPASENRFMIPGWLSFRAPAACRQVNFIFQDGDAETRPRPDPAVRTWWIEIVNDPYFRKLNHLICPKGQLSQLPEGGISAAKSFFLRHSAFSLKNGMPYGGRRIVSLMRTTGSAGNYYTIGLFNAAKHMNHAIHVYFQAPPDIPYDSCCEAYLAAPGTALFNHPQRGGAVQLYHSPMTIHFFHVQLHPSTLEIGVKLPSDTFFTEDHIDLEITGLNSEALLPFKQNGIEGKRVMSIKHSPGLNCRLLDQNGIRKREWTGRSHHLTNAVPGKYILEVDITDGTTRLRRQHFNIDIIKAPQW